MGEDEGARHGEGSDAGSGEDGAPQEEPWVVNEYRPETPMWFDLLFDPGFGVAAPLLVAAGYGIWRWLSG